MKMHSLIGLLNSKSTRLVCSFTISQNIPATAVKDGFVFPENFRPAPIMPDEYSSSSDSEEEEDK